MHQETARRRRLWPPILAGGLIAGTIDIGMAAWINWLDPRIILHFIAGGVLGAVALQGAIPASLLGLLLQWGMSILIAAIFVVTAAHWRWLVDNPLRAGIAYGVIVFVVMNYVVMPLSAWHRINHFTTAGFFENLAAMVLFGLIVALATHRSLGKREDNAS